MKRSILFLGSAIMLAVIPQVLMAQIHFTATLDGAQQVPAVVTNATGTGSFELSEDLSELRYFVSYQGMAMVGVDGHFHTGLPGANGNIEKELPTPTSTSGTFAGVWKSTDTEPLTQALVESLLTGRVYINLHSPANPGGEIRGQLVLMSSLHFEANYTGAQENPPVSELSGGTGVFVLDKSRTKVDYWITYHGLTSTLTAGGHIHVGAVGKNGTIVKNLAATGGPVSNTLKGTWAASDGSQPLTSALVDSLIGGKLYSNFHTTLHGGGEIRGQLFLKAGICFVAALDSTQENPPTIGPGTGTGSFVLNAARTQLSYHLTYIKLSSNLTAGGHIHRGAVGKNGGIVKNIASTGDTSEATISGTWSTTDVSQALTPALVESLFTGRLYANFHTVANGGGEIRGQLNNTTGIGFTATLSPNQENPPTASTGSGTASVVLSPDRQSVSYSVTYLGLTGVLSGAGGHFHAAPRGVNAGVVKTIAAGGGPAAASVNGTWNATDGTQPLTSALVDSLIAGKIYTNFHTIANAGGEIRGQVTFGNDVPTSVRELAATVPGEFRLEQNYPNPFNPSTAIRFDVPKAARVTLVVYNILGQRVAILLNELKAPGVYEVPFDATGIASGVYFYRLSTENGVVASRKMMLLK